MFYQNCQIHLWRHNTQHNDTQYNDIQHNLTQHYGIQHNKKMRRDTQHNTGFVMLSVLYVECPLF